MRLTSRHRRAVARSMTTFSDSCWRVATRRSAPRHGSHSRCATCVGSPSRRSAPGSLFPTPRCRSAWCVPARRSKRRRSRSRFQMTRPCVIGSATFTRSSMSFSPKATLPRAQETQSAPTCARRPSGSPVRSSIFNPRATRAEVSSPCCFSSMHATRPDSTPTGDCCESTNKTANAGTRRRSKKPKDYSQILRSRHSAPTASRPQSLRSTAPKMVPTGRASRTSTVSCPDSPPPQSSRSTVQSQSDAPTAPTRASQ